MNIRSTLATLAVLVGPLFLGCAHGVGLDDDDGAAPHITSISTPAFATTETTGTDAVDTTNATGSPLTTDAATPTTTGGPDESSGVPSTAGSNTSATDTAGSDLPMKLDQGTPADLPDDGEVGCTNIDILFVIDNSYSMKQKQTKLLESFDGFIAAIETSLAGISYHVGVVTSDYYGYNSEDCRSIGDLVSQTGGEDSWWGTCTPFAEGLRFATEKDDLGAKFPCMAQVGTGGSPLERPVTALIHALGPDKALPGACNEGFLRDDAILVVVIITDDPPYEPNLDDAHPATDTSGWHAAVLAAKGNNPAALVVIGFVPWGDMSCSGNKNTSPNLFEFVQSFGGQGVLASICEPSFAPIFADAVDNIVTTCENFPLPG